LALIIAVSLGLGAEIKPLAGDVIRLEVFKTGLMRGKKHIFEFPAYSGTLSADRSSLEISLESAKIELKDDWLKDSDLKKVLEFTLKDMLDASRHPRITFRSTKVEIAGQQATAQGILTIRGISKPATLSIRESSPGVYEGGAKVDMREFNLKPPSAALGAVGTDPNLVLSFRLTVR
jgi:polyisoprenoid-binding protein YceI